MSTFTSLKEVLEKRNKREAVTKPTTVSQSTRKSGLDIDLTEIVLTNKAAANKVANMNPAIIASTYGITLGEAIKLSRQAALSTLVDQ